MCSLVTLKVIKLLGSKVVLSDGRKVLLGGVKGIKAGDFVKVYADIIIEKADLVEN